MQLFSYQMSKKAVKISMCSESLTLKDGILLEQILCAKAEELNQLFQTDKWTPRKIDKVLWAYRE